MRLFQTFAGNSGHRYSINGGMWALIWRFCRGANGTPSATIQSSPFHRLIHSAMVLLSLLILNPGGVVVYAASTTLQDPAPAPALEETESFMGMPVGAFVRVKCTAPAIELNNAKLLAVAKTTITVTTVNGERFTLPKDSTEVGTPVNWQRTATVLTPELNRSQSWGRHWGWVVLLLLLAGAGVAAWLQVVRRPETSAGKKVALPAASRLELDQAPPPLRREQPDSDGVDNLIETRCYGTAIERLEQQIKLQPGDFSLRLKLLQVYSVIGNKKQIDRVSHQIEFHRDFSPEQKRQASQLVAPAKNKEGSKPQPAASPPKTTAASSRPLEQDRQVAEMIALAKEKEALKAQAAASLPQAAATASRPPEQKRETVEPLAPPKDEEGSKALSAASPPQVTAAPSRPLKRKRQAVELSGPAKNKEGSKTRSTASSLKTTATPSPQLSS